MGVTLYYSGTLRSLEHDTALQRIVLKWAKHWKCDVLEVDQEHDLMIQMRDGKATEYRGPLSGFILFPHPEAESLSLVHAPDGYLWHFCKTQFAGPRTHMEVVEFLEEIAPFFKDFKIVDDGGYWPNRDRKELERRMGIIDGAIDGLSKAFPVSKKHSDRSPKSGMN